ncbi:MAG TPA: glycosyltransferase [Paludibaculum sp.]|jgi:MGT family glycosyltransferase
MQPPGVLQIVFAVHCGAGHTNSSFSLARQLRDRGHRVVYLGLAAARPLVVQNGFEFVPFAEDIVPETAYQPTAGPGLSWWRRRLAEERLFASFLERCSNGELDRLLLSCHPDLVICDSLVWYIGLRSQYLGIPTLGLSVFLASPPNSHVPPVLYPRVPRDSWWSRMQVRADWWGMRWRFFFTKSLVPRLWSAYRFPTRMHHLTGEFKRLARRSGLACKEGHTYWAGIVGPHLMLPEIVMCPRAFDFGGAGVAGQRYLGGMVDAGRLEDSSLLEGLDPEKPLVYCSLGSDAHFYPHSEHFFRTVCAAAELRRDWQWVLSAGSKGAAGRHRGTSANLCVVSWTPQLALLRRAAVMVTHCGLNSILECIHFGVPMVAVPGLRDQPGNMARAVHHGIAVAAKMKELTAEQLVALIDGAMHSEDLRQALSRMKGAVEEENGLAAAIELLESSGARKSGQSA